MTSLLVGILAGLDGAAASADPTGFVQGGGDARASLQSLNLIGGGIKLTATEGVVFSHYVGSLGQSEGRAVDMGLFPTIFGPIGTCDGQTPILAPESLPPSTLTDSAQPDAAQSRRTAVTMPGLRGKTTSELVGYQDAIARPGPFAQAITDIPRGDFGFATVTENGHTDVTTQIVNGTREAHAVVTADRMTFLGGLVVLNHPRWEAVARSGAVTTTEGRFTFTDATLLGFHRTVDQAKADFAGFSQGLSQALGAIGGFIEFPTVKVDQMSVEVTSLKFGIRDLPLGRDTLGPLLQFFEKMAPKPGSATTTTTTPCPDLWVDQILSVTKDLLSGRGSVEFYAGGVFASTDDTYYAPLDDGFTGNSSGFDPLPNDSEVPTPAPSAPSPTYAPTTSPPDTVVDPTPTSEVPAVAPAPPPSDSSTTTEPDTANTVEIPLPPPAPMRSYIAGHKGGATATVAFAGLALALALFAADRFVIRRSTRSTTT